MLIGELAHFLELVDDGKFGLQEGVVVVDMGEYLVGQVGVVEEEKLEVGVVLKAEAAEEFLVGDGSGHQTDGVFMGLLVQAVNRVQVPVLRFLVFPRPRVSLDILPECLLIVIVVIPTTATYISNECLCLKGVHCIVEERGILARGVEEGVELSGSGHEVGVVFGPGLEVDGVECSHIGIVYFAVPDGEADDPMPIRNGSGSYSLPLLLLLPRVFKQEFL